MSLTGVSAKDRAAALARYPSVDDASSTMPANLVYQLALTRAEEGQYDQALALFKERFFPSEEGGVSAKQVLFEIKLMQAEAEAASGKCADTESFLAADHPGLVLNGAVGQAYVRMAAIAKLCLRQQESDQFLQKAAASKTIADAPWAARAQQLLGTYDAAQIQQKLETSLADARHVADPSNVTGWSWYNIGAIELALNHKDLAREAFNKSLLLPDSMMSHHLARAAMTGSETSRAAHEQLK